MHWNDRLAIIVEDDGVGLGAALPSSAGAGQGLLHSTMMAVVGGTLTAARSPSGTLIVLALPQAAYGAALA